MFFSTDSFNSFFNCEEWYHGPRSEIFVDLSMKKGRENNLEEKGKFFFHTNNVRLAGKKYFSAY